MKLLGNLGVDSFAFNKDNFLLLLCIWGSQSWADLIGYAGSYSKTPNFIKKIFDVR